MKNRLLLILAGFCLLTFRAPAQTKLTDIQWVDTELSSMPTGYYRK